MTMTSLLENEPLEKSYDVVIVGSGAGGGLAALELTKKGLKVALFEMGPGKKTRDFKMNEGEAYQNLYQESAGRMTKDGAVTILQGRTLGGGTTVNWTSSFDTPPLTMKYWREELGLKNLSEDNLKPHFKKARELLNVKEWDLPVNRNNDVLRSGLSKMGVSYGRIHRNVKNCLNLGYCGMGCPVGAKQSALVTTIKTAESQGLHIYTDAQVMELKRKDARVNEMVVCPRGKRNKKFSIVADRFILAAGAIGTPALLLRSHVPDPYGHTGKRTFLHPTTISGALFKDEVAPYYGAPQSIYSDDFIPKELKEKNAGFKLEVPPIHPLLLATSLPWWGKTHRDFMEKLPFLQATIALQRDGFHELSQGGQVLLNNQQEPILDYSITSYMMQGFMKSLEVMGELQLAAGAYEVAPLHRQGYACKNLTELKKMIKTLPQQKRLLKLVSAHVMGGCPMGRNPESGVVDDRGKHFFLKNVWVMDGSIFPTSLGTNPMISIMAHVSRFLEEFT